MRGCYLLFCGCCLIVVRCVLFLVCRLLCVDYWYLFGVVCRSLCVLFCLLFVSCWSLFVVCGLLFVVCCFGVLVFDVRCVILCVVR